MRRHATTGASRTDFIPLSRGTNDDGRPSLDGWTMPQAYPPMRSRRGGAFRWAPDVKRGFFTPRAAARVKSAILMRCRLPRGREGRIARRTPLRVEPPLRAYLLT